MESKILISKGNISLQLMNNTKRYEASVELVNK